MNRTSLLPGSVGIFSQFALGIFGGPLGGISIVASLLPLGAGLTIYAHLCGRSG